MYDAEQCGLLDIATQCADETAAGMTFQPGPMDLDMLCTLP